MCLYVDICMPIKCLWRGEKGNGLPKMMLQVTESCHVGAGIHTESSARAFHVHNNCWSILQVSRGNYCLNNNILRILFRKFYGKERSEIPVCTWGWGYAREERWCPALSLSVSFPWTNVSLNQKIGWWPPGLRNALLSPSSAGVTDLCVIMPKFVWGFWVLELRF